MLCYILLLSRVCSIRALTCFEFSALVCISCLLIALHRMREDTLKCLVHVVDKLDEKHLQVGQGSETGPD